MPCRQCDSDNQRLFNGEIAIHFPGLDGLDKPIVWVFRKLVVCLECGLAEFPVPGKELAVLAERAPATGSSEPRPAAEHLLRMAKPA
jgi:hypothetical protein